MKMRRLSGVIAILALSRLFLSGAIAICPAVTGAALSQHAPASSATAVDRAHHDDERTSCDIAGAGDCSDARHVGCLAMSSCANAIVSTRGTNAVVAATKDQPSTPVASLLLEPARTPEPPPPRA